MRREKAIRPWNSLDEWEILPDEAYALRYALERLWHEAALMRYFNDFDFQAWSLMLKGSSRIKPMPKDIEFFEALTRIALDKLSDLPPDAVLEDGAKATDHRRSLRNFRARNLGIED
jgi:hypothetical protein